jgi:excisionase family DNA binding protein
VTKDTPVTHEYVTPAEIAEELRITRMTVHRMIKRGELPALVLGPRTFRVPAQAYAAYKEQLHEQATAATPATPPVHPGQLQVDDLPEATD